MTNHRKWHLLSVWLFSLSLSCSPEFQVKLHLPLQVTYATLRTDHDSAFHQRSHPNLSCWDKLRLVLEYGWRLVTAANWLREGNVYTRQPNNLWQCECVLCVCVSKCVYLYRYVNLAVAQRSFHGLNTREFLFSYQTKKQSSYTAKINYFHLDIKFKCQSNQKQTKKQTSKQINQSLINANSLLCMCCWAQMRTQDSDGLMTSVPKDQI